MDFSQFEYKPREKFEARIIVARNLEKLYNIPASYAPLILSKKSIQMPHLRVEVREAPKLIQRAARLRKYCDITFTGRVERSEMGKLYNKHDNS